MMTTEITKAEKNKRSLQVGAEKFINEYLRCKNSFLYFCSRYIKIEQVGGDVAMHPYGPQKNLINTIQNDNFVLVLKSRQIGISTIIQAYCTWLTSFYDNVVVGIISKDAAEATDFARKIRGMVDKLPKWMSPGYDKYTEQSFILKNGSKVYASPVNPNAPEKTLRGKAITFLVIDEAAFIKFIDDAWTSMVPALSTSQMHARKNDVPYGTIVLSTPNKTVGTGKWFYEKYSKAEGNDDIFTPFVIHWKDVEELASDPDWYETQCQLFDNDPKKIEQELELKFLATSGSFFDDETTRQLQEINEKPVETQKLFNGEGWRYAPAELGRYYITGVDTAPEHGEDFSALSVWDYQTLEQVYEYQGKCKVEDFVKVVKAVISQYPGLVVVESNSYGNQVVEAINSSEYSAMLYKEKRGSTKKLVAGLSTNSKTRPLMIDALYSYVSQFTEGVKSKRLILELIGLISKTNGRVEADTGCHDDLVFSAALAFYVHKWDPPMMLQTASTALMRGDLNDVLSMNDGILSHSPQAGMLKKIKKELDEVEPGTDMQFVDILSMYQNN